MGQINNMIYNLVGKAGFNKEAPMLDAFLHQSPTSIFDLSPYFLQLEPFLFFPSLFHVSFCSLYCSLSLFPFPMFFPTYICQAKVMSQLIYHPAIF